MNRGDWWGYVYPKNLDKHATIKLVVPRLVEHLKVSLATRAILHLDNVDVGGIVPARDANPAFLLGALNGPVAGWVFRIIAKPFRGDYRSANRQFLAPLPVPRCSPEEQAQVAALARRLQERHTARRDGQRAASERLAVLSRNRRPARWLWPDLPTLPETIERAPRALKQAGERRDWANRQLDEMEAARVAALQAALDTGEAMEPSFREGELRLYVGGAILLDRIFLGDRQGQLAESYWRWLLLERVRRDAKTFAAALRDTPADVDSPAAAQFRERVGRLADDAAAIEDDEQAMNELLYALYRLTEEEREIVEKGRAA